MTEINGLLARLWKAEKEFDDAYSVKVMYDERVDRLAGEIDTLRIEIQVAELLSAGVAEFAETRRFSEIFNSANSVTQPTLETMGENMTTSRILAAELNKQDLSVRRGYAELSDEQKAEVEAAFRRHFTACQKSGIPAEPGFLRETLMDMRAGIHESVEGRVTSDEQIQRKSRSGETLATHHSPLVTKESVGEMVQTAFTAAGGVGSSEPVVIR